MARLLAAVAIAFAAITVAGDLIKGAVAPLLPGIDPRDLYLRVDAVVTCLAVLVALVWPRRKD
jgi:hypothetical protein